MENYFFYHCSLCDNVGNLENRCEELQKLLEDARTMIEKQQQAQRRRRERRKSSQSQSRMEQTKDSPDDEEHEEESTSAIVQEESNHQSDEEESDCRTGSGSGIPESGYSSGSVESHLHRLGEDDVFFNSHYGPEILKKSRQKNS